MPRVAFVRAFMLNHWYHHRGQLLVYLRLLDVPVPSVYGPTADETTPSRADDTVAAWMRSTSRRCSRRRPSSSTTSAVPGLPVEPTEDEFTSDLRLVFPYRGVFVRHVGDDQAVAEPGQVLFFNAGEAYRISHPVPGRRCLPEPRDQRSAAPRADAGALLRDGAGFVFRQQRLRIDPRAQALWHCCGTAPGTVSPKRWKPRAWR